VMDWVVGLGYRFRVWVVGWVVGEDGGASFTIQ